MQKSRDLQIIISQGMKAVNENNPGRGLRHKAYAVLKKNDFDITLMASDKHSYILREIQRMEAS